jgi:hypothetical protein
MKRPKPRTSTSVRNEQTHVHHVLMPARDRVLQRNARVSHLAKRLASDAYSEEKKISVKRILNANARPVAPIGRSANLLRVTATVEPANSAVPKAGHRATLKAIVHAMAHVLRGPRPETPASARLAAIDHHVASSLPALAMKPRLANLLEIGNRVLVLANLRSDLIARKGKVAHHVAIVPHVKVDSVDRTLAVADQVPAAEVQVLAVAARVPVAADLVREGPVREALDQAVLVLGDQSLAGLAPVEEVQDLHFVAISFSDTLIRRTYLYLCRRSPNWYRSA